MGARELDAVDVYFNLHRKTWSCKSRKTGRVVAHADVVVASYGATMVVQEAGRQRVLQEQRKNVHAFARLDHGECFTDGEGWRLYAQSLPNAVKVSYNPYRAGHFYRTDTQEPVESVKSIIMVALPEKPPEVWAVI